MCINLKSASVFVDVIPTSANHLRLQRTLSLARSQSTFSVLSARSFSQPLLDAVLEDDIITQEVVSDDQPDFQDTSSNPILKWADICDTSLQKAAHTSIRHSNIVKFSFRVLEIPEDHESFIDLIRSLRCDDDTSIMTLPMKRGQLHDLERYWTGVNMQKSYGRSITSRPDQRVRTFLLFRTFCQQDDWQLNRELYCVVWSLRAASLLEMFLGVDFDFIFDQDCPPSVPDSEFIRAFQQLRELSGTQSVAYALDNTSLILLPSGNASDHETRLQWCQPQSHGIPEHEIERSVAWFDIASCSEDDAVQSYHHQGGRLLWATRKEQATSAPPGFMIIPDNVGKGGGMLVVKPSNWPQQCPRFCLFVLLNHDFQDEACLGNLLRSTIQMRDMYRVYEDGSQEPEAFSAADSAPAQNLGRFF